MRQLSLFSAETEATRQLQESFDILGADYGRLEARLETARVEYAKVRRQLRACEAERTALVQDVRAAQLEVRHWKAMYDIALMVRPSTPTRAPEALEKALKRLLLICHPDKWQQGQPAAELAHALTITINGLRAHGEGRL